MIIKIINLSIIQVIKWITVQNKNYNNLYPIDKQNGIKILFVFQIEIK